MNYSEFFTMRMELLVLAVFVLVFLFDTFCPERCRRHVTPLTLVLFGAATVLGFFCCGSGTAFGGMYETSPIICCVKCILNIGAFIVFLQAVKWIDSDEGAVRRGEFFELMLVTLFGMYLMISARHFLLFIIGLECASLPLAAMVAFQKNKYESHEAAVKYIFTAVFSSAIMMMGLSFVYACTANGSLYFSDIAESIRMGQNSVMLITAIAFVIAGFGFKLSLVPFHLWTADVYQGAPTSVTSYLSVISKGSAAFAFLVVLCQAFGAVYSDIWEWMMYALIILTITVGNLFAVRQRNMKRFMAFSSVSQAGYIMLGIIAANTLGMASMVFYVLVYVFSNLGVFGVIQAIENKTGMVSMDQYKGLHKTNPWLAFAMTLAVFSLAGIPPFAGFFSKILIFTAACEVESAPMYILVLIALINTIISLYYYLLVVKAMWISPDEPVIPNFRSAGTERVALWICTLGIGFIGLVSCLYTILYDASVEATDAGFFAFLG